MLKWLKSPFSGPKPAGPPQVLRAFAPEKPTAEGLKGRAFLEMWCRLPGRGEFFSKGLQQVLSGTASWARYEISFYLKEGQKPDLIKPNLAVEGTGTVWLKNVELLETPLVS